MRFSREAGKRSDCQLVSDLCKRFIRVVFCFCFLKIYISREHNGKKPKEVIIPDQGSDSGVY